MKRLAVAVLLAAFATGCTGGGDPGGFAVYDRDESAEGDHLVGPLRGLLRIEGDCVLMTSAEDPGTVEPVLLVLPENHVDWDGETGTLIVDEVEYFDGDTVESAGPSGLEIPDGHFGCGSVSSQYVTELRHVDTP